MDLPGGLRELVRELRSERDGKDCIFNVVVHIAEGRGLRGLANHGLNDCKARVYLSTEPLEKGKVSMIHKKTSTPFFDWVSKLTFKGQPLAFFTSYLVIEVLQDRGVLSEKLIGLLQIGILDVYLSCDHKFPMQWYTIVDLESEEPAIATGYLRLSVIINTMDESGAALEQIPEEERSRCELMEIPSQHNYLTATGSYNLIFKVYQGSDLRVKDTGWMSSDTYVKISTPTGVNYTDTRWSDLNPTYNQQLQIPLFEPMFRSLILVELWSSGSADSLVATIPMSWKDIFCNQEYYKLPRWYDLFALPDAGKLDQIVDNLELTGNKLVQWTHKAASAAIPEYWDGFTRLRKNHTGQFQEASVYCGRLLFSVEVENREGASKQPSLAQTDMKPKDCNLFKSTKHTMMFRLQIFHGQGLKVPLDGKAEVEVQIGNKTAVSARVGIVSDICDWYQAVELELDVPYDENMWPWSDEDYEDGWFPADIIDHALPPVWIRVFRSGMSTRLNNLVGGSVSGRQLIGFYKSSLRDLLQLEDERPSMTRDPRHDQHLRVTNNRNCTVILNKKGSSHPPFFVAAAEEPRAWYNARNTKLAKQWTMMSPPWPKDDDGRGNTMSMDPYVAAQCIELDKDGTCCLESSEAAGFLWLSLKLYLPSRGQVENAKKGPPILSPFAKYNPLPIPRPLEMHCMENFLLRLHVYQAKDIPTVNPVGLASAYVQVLFCRKTASTHTVKWSNSPTWDTTLTTPKVNLPCLGWPGNTALDVDEEEDDHKRYNVFEDGDPETWMENYSMLRFAQRIEVRVMEKHNQQPKLLGRCFLRPEDCLHTQVDPQWFELYLGNPEQDEGKILLSAQILHEADPIVKDPPGPLLPQRLDAEHAANKRKVEHDAGYNWNIDGAENDVGGVKYFSDAFCREKMPPNEDARNASRVNLRDCKVQVQVLGLRKMRESLGLRSPKLHLFIQTTDRWDGDPQSYKSTKPKEDALNPNYMETFELDVLLPDDEEYAPDLEFIVTDEEGGWSAALKGLWGSGKGAPVVWGSLPLRDFYPQGGKGEGEEEDEDEEDPNAMRRKRIKKRDEEFDELIAGLQENGTITAQEEKALRRQWEDDKRNEDGDGGGRPGEVMQAFNMYLDAPSDEHFIERTERFLMAQQNKKIQKEMEDGEKAKKNQEDKEKKAQAQKKKAASGGGDGDNQPSGGGDAGPASAEQVQVAGGNMGTQRDEYPRVDPVEVSSTVKPGGNSSGGAAHVTEYSRRKRDSGEELEPRGGGEEGEHTDGDAGEQETTSRETSDEDDVQGACGRGSGGGAGGNAGADAVATEEGDPGPGMEGAGVQVPARRSGSVAQGGPDRNGGVGGEETRDDRDGTASVEGREDEEAAGGQLTLGDKGPSNYQPADNPQQALMASRGVPVVSTAPDGVDPVIDMADAGDEGDAVDVFNTVLPKDDEEPDRQETVDTPDGRPNAEWIAFRKHFPFKRGLEETEEWGPLFNPSFEEVKLFQGRVRDYKRRDAEAVGLVKCRIKVFRKEDETKAGKSKRDNNDDPRFFQVKQDHESIKQALDLCLPYKMANIYETYPPASVEVRAYCLKAFQVTPGGFGRKEDGVEYWMHYLSATLGPRRFDSELQRALNPSFFHVFIFKDCPIPGPSQLIISLRDAAIGEDSVFNPWTRSGQVDKFKTIGETIVDLEDRWFCDKWKEEKYKPREIRDLVNEEEIPGVSQGKLSLFVDLVEQSQAEANPPWDIQVLGKTLPMELRVVVWNTKDTAAKDMYTSDVYLVLEMLGVGAPKQTDVHKNVKKKAYGMFNYRLKWKCRYPNDKLEYLMRIAIWDEDTFGSHDSIAEGVLPLKSLFNDCFQRNQGKTSPDEMEEVWLEGEKSEIKVDLEGNKYKCSWFYFVHPNEGYNPKKQCQAKVQISVTVLPRAKARAKPAGRERRSPAKLPPHGRPPQPADPIFHAEECKEYIIYSCNELLKKCRGWCICLCCLLLVAGVIAAVVGIRMALA